MYLLHWMAALTADSPPRFEILVEAQGDWTPPASTPDFAVVAKGRSMTALGPVANTGGWHAWWAARWVAATLVSLPEGSSIDIAMAPRLDDDAELDPAIGRALYSGTVKGGLFEITHASPRVTYDTLASAVEFVRNLAVGGRMTVRGGSEREAFDKAHKMYSMVAGPVVWDGEVVRLAEPDERSLIMLATKLFRIRFGEHWPVDAGEDV